MTTIAQSLIASLDGDSDYAYDAAYAWATDGIRPSDFTRETLGILGRITPRNAETILDELRNA